MTSECIVDIIAQGAWKGGTLVDNAFYENKGMLFKGGIPVTSETIEARIGVRTRMAAPAGERIGVLAFEDLLTGTDVDPHRIKLLISATNIGEDREDPGPFVRFPHALVGRLAPRAAAFDLYAGCPGFNVAVESIFMLAQAGRLDAGDVAVIVGAENIQRADVFKPLDTANIIFGDDAMATALRVGDAVSAVPGGEAPAEIGFEAGEDFIGDIAALIAEHCPNQPVDGIIVDNRLGRLEFRVPASAVRIQHALVERLHPDAAARGTFLNFREALEFYDRRIQGFAYDIMSLDGDPGLVRQLAGAYAASGKCRRVAAVFLDADRRGVLSIHSGSRRPPRAPRQGIIDTLTRTHGCFAGYIEALREADRVYGHIDGKGVFLHATRGAKNHIETLLSRNGLSLADIELMIEHQANFAMIPLTLDQVMESGRPESKQQVADFLANRMVTNVHLRGNCSVVCMQRLPYDLDCGTLTPDTIQGFAVNQNTERLQSSRLILYDSVGAGMTRSSFLRRR